MIQGRGTYYYLLLATSTVQVLRDSTSVYSYSTSTCTNTVVQVSMPWPSGTIGSLIFFDVKQLTPSGD